MRTELTIGNQTYTLDNLPEKINYPTAVNLKVSKRNGESPQDHIEIQGFMSIQDLLTDNTALRWEHLFWSSLPLKADMLVDTDNPVFHFASLNTRTAEGKICGVLIPLTKEFVYEKLLREFMQPLGLKGSQFTLLIKQAEEYSKAKAELLEANKKSLVLAKIKAQMAELGLAPEDLATV